MRTRREETMSRRETHVGEALEGRLCGLESSRGDEGGLGVCCVFFDRATKSRRLVAPRGRGADLEFI